MILFIRVDYDPVHCEQHANPQLWCKHLPPATTFENIEGQSCGEDESQLEWIVWFGSSAKSEQPLCTFIRKMTKSHPISCVNHRPVKNHLKQKTKWCNKVLDFKHGTRLSWQEWEGKEKRNNWNRREQKEVWIQANIQTRVLDCILKWSKQHKEIKQKRSFKTCILD